MTHGQIREKMPKIVDKVQKRKDIAKSTCSLFVKKGFVSISISEIAKIAGVGKGTIYEYFKNKEDIVFELMACLQEDYDPKLEQNLLSTKDIKRKVQYLFDLFLNDTETIKIQRKIFREFLAIYLNNPSEEIVEFHTTMIDKYTVVLTNIINEGIENKVLIKDSLKFIPSIFATIEGFFMVGSGKEQIIEYLDNLFLVLAVNENE